MVKQLGFGLLGMLLCATMAAAQATMTVSGGNVLTSGDTIQIRYSNPARANGSVFVTIDDGEFPTPTYLEVQIHLDARGEGSIDWVVPCWSCAHFNADGVREVTRAVS